MLENVEKIAVFLEKIIAVLGWGVRSLRSFPREKFEPNNGNKDGI
jgi:hypothetical protein